MRSVQLPSLLVLLSAAVVTADASNTTLPIVDLKYTRQQASSYNSSSQIYTFSNIRFAEPPVGDLRFAAPVPVKENATLQTDDGSPRSCYQALPGWENIAGQFIPDYLFNNTAAFYNQSTSGSSGPPPQIPPPGPDETEDCLFLDVVVPQSVYDNKDKCDGAAVIVWIYGGGYVVGNKAGNGSPVGLIQQSASGTGGSVIFVAMNYRLGAFGWLGGPSLQANGSANAGLLDQRLALEWVQEHIHAFGGDPKRVTVIGESAGGGSIMHQITAYGGSRGPVPFQQAIPQSAAFQPIPGNYLPEQTTQQFLKALNVSTVQDARGLSSMALRNANSALVGGANYGQFTFGPIVDNDFVPGLPGKLLLQGAFDKSLKLLIGHNANEGLIFTDPYITNDTAYDTYVQTEFPEAAPDVISYITRTLYPPVFNGTLPYSNDFERATFTTAEFVFTCNTNYLARAFHNQTYNYLFSVPPALHGQDVGYTFFGSGQVSGALPLPINATVAAALQKYITEFAESGQPNEQGVPHFAPYGPDARLENLGATDINQITDPTANPRCAWWQKALYF